MISPLMHGGNAGKRDHSVLMPPKRINPSKLANFMKTIENTPFFA